MSVATPVKVPASAKKPTDRQPKSGASEELEDFSFEWPPESGEVFAVPPQSTIKSGVLRRLRKLEGIDFVYSLMEEVWPEDAVEATDAMSQEQLLAVFSDYQKHSGVSLGE